MGFFRCWGPTVPYHLPQFLKELQNIPLVFIRDVRDKVFNSYGVADISDESTLSRMEIADILFDALDAAAKTGLDIPKFYTQGSKTRYLERLVLRTNIHTSYEPLRITSTF